MSTPEPNNTDAIRRSLTLLDQFEESLEDVAIEDWTWSGIERNIKHLRHALESELGKLEAELLQAFVARSAEPRPGDARRDTEETMKQGEAPCGRCDRVVTVALSGYYESDGGSGWNWECVSGQACECGEPFRWIHQPAPKEPIQWVTVANGSAARPA